MGQSSCQWLWSVPAPAWAIHRSSFPPNFKQGALNIRSNLGRDADPKKYLSGAMTNPNCEYSLNIPAILRWNHKRYQLCGLLMMVTMMMLIPMMVMIGTFRWLCWCLWFQPGRLGRSERPPLGTIWTGFTGARQPVHQPSCLPDNQLTIWLQARAVTALLEESRREGWGPPQVQVDDDGLQDDDDDSPWWSIIIHEGGWRWAHWGWLGCRLPVLLAPSQSRTHGGTLARRLQVVSCQHEWFSVTQLKWLIFTLTIHVHGTTIHLRQSSSSPPASPCPDPQWNLTKYQFHQPGGVATPLLQFEDGGGDLI